MNMPKLQDSCSCAIAILLKQAALSYVKDAYGLDTDYVSKAENE